MTLRLLATSLLAASLALTGCTMFQTGANKQEGEILLNAPHPLKPVDNEVYHISNLKEPGGKVFLFSSETTLAKCYLALAEGVNQEKICSPEIVAEVPDKATVRTLHCHNSEYAICTIQVMEGEEAGVKGAIMWDWLKARH